MSGCEALVRGREAFAGHRWREAHAELSAAASESRLDAAALEQLAMAAYLTGRDAEAAEIWERAHHELVDAGEVERAARVGFFLAFTFLLRGELAQSMGWLGRTERLLSDGARPCIEHGYLSALRGLPAMARGHADEALAQFEDALEIADRFGDPDLEALGLLGRGQALIQQRLVSEGVALLDQAMIAVTGGKVTPMLAGIVYCAVILTCQRVFDLQRAAEWTMALGRWCASEPELGAFRGKCLVHRSEILQLRGEWTESMAAAEQACTPLQDRPGTAAGRAHYQRAELHRLRGELERADELYREAARHGCEPQPGMSLLRLTQGQPDAAAAAIRRVLDEASAVQGPSGGMPRATMLGPCVEIMLGTGDVETAHAAAAELREIAERLDALHLRAMAGYATGSVLLAQGDARAALVELREAWTCWQQLESPYESARVRALIAVACDRLGDADTAELHRDAARTVFERLGAMPDAARLARISATPARTSAAALTGRELEVLRLVASGATNRGIAEDLGISEHTVARHLSNIFTKLGVTTRTAASAYAFEHGLA